MFDMIIYFIACNVIKLELVVLTDIGGFFFFSFGKQVQSKEL